MVASVNWDLLRTASSAVLALFSIGGAIVGWISARAVKKNSNQQELETQGARLTVVENGLSSARVTLTEHSTSLALIGQNLESQQRADAARDAKLDAVRSDTSEIIGMLGRGRGR